MTSPGSRRWVSLAASVAATLCAGLGYAWSVFMKPMAVTFNGSASDVSLSFTALVTSGAVAAVAAGWAQQYVRPRALLLIGGGLLGAGLICLGSVHSLSGMYAFAVLAGFGQGLVYPGSTMSNVIRFFPDKRGLASGLLTAGYGMGALVWAPISVHLIDQYGLTWALRILGVVVLVVIAICSRLVRTAPAEYVPAGWAPPVADASRAAHARGKDWKGMMGTPGFYVLAVLFITGTLSGLMVIGQASPIAQDILKISPEAASAVVGYLAIGMVVGKLGWGAVSDRLGRYPVFIALYAVATAAMIVMSRTTGYVPLVIAISAVGSCYGGFLSLMGPVTADSFGAKHLGINFGVMFLTLAVSSYAGPQLAARVAAANHGDYAQAFVIAALFNVVGLATCTCYLLVRMRMGSAKAPGRAACRAEE